MFYLLTALAMPLIEVSRVIRGRHDPTMPPPRWGLVLTQAAIAIGIVLAIVLVGWLLALLLPEVVADARGEIMGGVSGTPVEASNALRAGALLFSFVSLTAVVGSVEVFRLWRHARSARLRASRVAGRG
jgi:hypothetical protein